MRSMWAPVTVAVAIAVGLSVAALQVSDARGGAVAGDVTVNLQAKRQVIQGFGSSVRLFVDPHLSKSPVTTVPPAAQAQILTAVYRRLGLTRARDSLDGGIETSKGGPFNFGGKLTDAQIPFIKQAKGYGLRTFYPSPVYVEDWMQAGDPGSYVDYAMAILQQWRKLGLEPPYYSPLNEPAISHDFPPQWMHDVVVGLGQRLRAAGFKTKLVIPDDENPTDAYRRAVAVLQDPNARQYVGALAYHIYKWDRGDMVKMRDLGARYKLPVWMTEYTSQSYTDWGSSLDWGQKMHELLVDGGVNAVDYLWAFFGSWVQTDTMISISFDNGVFQSWAPTPIYWITGQYSRFVRPGFVRVLATPATSNGILTSAYIGPKSVVVVAINTSSSAQTVRVAVTGGKLKGLVRPVQSSASEHWKSLASLRPANGAFSTTVPAQSMTTFVAGR